METRYGIFEIRTIYENNGVYGDGFASWPVGTTLACVRTEGSVGAAREACIQLAEKNPGNSYFFAEVYGKTPPGK